MVLLITFLFFVLAVTGLALGVLMGREPLRGSCGGNACGRCARNCENDDRSAGRPVPDRCRRAE